MRKLGIIVLILTNWIWAQNCEMVANDVVNNMSGQKTHRVTINYSADKLPVAQACKNAILSKNQTFEVNLNPESGTNKLNFNVN